MTRPPGLLENRSDAAAARDYGAYDGKRSTWIGPGEEALFQERLPVVESLKTSIAQGKSILTTEANPDRNTLSTNWLCAMRSCRKGMTRNERDGCRSYDRLETTRQIRGNLFRERPGLRDITEGKV